MSPGAMLGTIHGILQPTIVLGFPEPRPPLLFFRTYLVPGTEKCLAMTCPQSPFPELTHLNLAFPKQFPRQFL